MPEPLQVQILLLVKTQVKCLVLLELFVFLPPHPGQQCPPALDLALVILDTAVSHTVLGCLWEYLTYWLQATHFGRSSSWLFQITSRGSLQGMLVQSQLMVWRRRRWGGIDTQGLSLQKEGGYTFGEVGA